MIPVAEALARCLALAPALGTEDIPLAEAAGRWLARPLAARRSQPPFAASAMDGYAVAGDPAPGASFRVVGEAPAGRAWPGRLAAGEALRIFTGAPVPEGADRVLIQEDVAREGDVIALRDGADAARHIRPLGGDFREGENLAPRRLRPADLGLLAAMNHAEMPVGRRPEVALIATGDELVMPGETPRPDQIVASNSFVLKAMFEAEGARVRLLPIARDTEASLTAAFGLAAGADLVVTTGGASVGDHDLVARVAGTLGLERSFWKIAMRPGKPLMAGRLGGAALVGLPGNPVSSVVCAILFVLPMLRAMQGAPEADIAPRPREGVLAEPVEANGPRAHYMRARLVGGTGLAALPDQDSSLLSVLAAADALLIRPPGDPARPRGFPATWLPL